MSKDIDQVSNNLNTNRVPCWAAPLSARRLLKVERLIDMPDDKSYAAQLARVDDLIVGQPKLGISGDELFFNNEEASPPHEDLVDVAAPMWRAATPEPPSPTSSPVTDHEAREWNPFDKDLGFPFASGVEEHSAIVAYNAEVE